MERDIGELLKGIGVILSEQQLVKLAARVSSVDAAIDYYFSNSGLFQEELTAKQQSPSLHPNSPQPPTVQLTGFESLAQVRLSSVTMSERLSSTQSEGARSQPIYEYYSKNNTWTALSSRQSTRIELGLTMGLAKTAYSSDSTKGEVDFLTMKVSMHGKGRSVRRMASTPPENIWEYFENGTWKPYDSDASDFLNRCRIAGLNRTVIYSMRGSKVIEYAIDLSRSTQVNTSTSYERQIRCCSSTDVSTTIKSNSTKVKLGEGQKYDYKDTTDKWHNIIVTKAASGQLQLHYIGFPRGFDECVFNKDELAPLYSHTPRWREDVAEGDSVDIFFPEINRWEKVSVKEVSSDKASIKIFSGSTDWIPLTSERVAKRGSRSGKKSCSFPHGVDKAIEVARAYESSKSPDDYQIALQIYEELATKKLLPHPICIDLFCSYEENGHLRADEGVETIRYRDSKAAFLLEAAFAIGQNDDEFGPMMDTAVSSASSQAISLTVGRTTFGNLMPSEFDTDKISDDDDDNGNGDVYFDPTLSGVNPFIRYAEKFHVALVEDWGGISSNMKSTMYLIDLLESKAWKSTSCVQRRMLFAEAAKLIQTVGNSCSNRYVRDFCHFRLARHYANGLGIDTTSLTLQDVADIQASDYMRLSKRSRNVMGLLAMLLSVGRNNAAIATETVISTKSIKKLFDGSIGQGEHSAAFWRAKLLFEGWGDQTTENRMESLQEALRLFLQCEAFAFNTTASKCLGDRTLQLTSATHIHRTEPFFLLSLHGYCLEIKSTVIETFPLILHGLIETFAQTNLVDGAALPAPPRLVGEFRPEWLLLLQEKVLFNNTFMQDCGDNDDSKGGGGKGAIARQTDFDAAWMRQIFNNTFLPEDAADTFPRYTIQHTKELLQQILVAASKARNVCCPFVGNMEPVTEVSARLTSANMTVLPAKLSQKWRKVCGQAASVYNSIPPLQRFYSEQTSFYDDVVDILNSSERTAETLQVSNSNTEEDEPVVAACKVISLARSLAKESREADADIRNKHFKSALAVLKYAKDEHLSVEAAIERLNRIAFPILTGVLSCPYPARIGYHTIVDAYRVDSFLGRRRAVDRSFIEKKTQFLTSNSGVNDNWRGGQDKSLLLIFGEFQELVRAQHDANLEILHSRSEPIMNTEALTFLDPWSYLMHVDIDGELTTYFGEVQTLAQETGMSEADVVDLILTQHIGEYFMRLQIDDTIGNRLNSYKTPELRIQLKKKMMYLLKTAPDVDWDDPSSVALLGSRLNLGLQGRCADGVSSFCDDFIQQTMFLKNQSLLTELPDYTSRLVLCVSGLIYSMKSDFIKKHLSRHKSDYEARTSGSLLLTYMLMLPLGLSGEYSAIIYPHLATKGYSDKSQMGSDAVVRRFLEGGDVRFEYGEVEHFEPLSLIRIAKHLQSSIVKSETGLDKSQAPETNPDLESRVRSDYTIDEHVITEFCEHDLMISPFYHESKTNQYTHPNLFFSALDEEFGEDDSPSSADTRPLIAKIMKDAVLLRILEVSLYSSVPPRFWENLKKDWRFEALTVIKSPLQPRMSSSSSSSSSMSLPPPPSPQSGTLHPPSPPSR